MQLMEPLDARHLFPLTEHYIHMNHAGVSPMSERVRAGIEQVIEASMEAPYRDHWAQDEADRVRGLVGQLINAPEDCIALTRSTAHGISLLAQGLDWEAGDNVVGATGEYPANVYPWMSLAARGVEFRQAQPVAGRITCESVLALIDRRTRVVALSHVEFWNGYRVDIQTIGDECRRKGIIFAVDVMQSAGALRIDTERMPIDFCAAGAGKWLMGPPGIGFCFCSADLLDKIHPVIVGVRSVVGDDRYFDYDLKLKPNARRFEESVVSLLDTAAFGAALELLLEVGPEVIERRVLHLTSTLAEGLASNGCEVVEPWPRTENESSGIVSFRKPGTTAPAMLRDLNASHVIARTHRDFVRLSPHFYNTEEEVDRVLDVLAPERVTER
jgi:selenocysteine lyase/cysteine desulfurase